jgi:group I intron endonuclease
MVGIYKIVNIIDGKCYYGSSADIDKRFLLHLRTLRNGTHHNTHLQRAWIKYGEDAFVFEVVEECSTSQLLIVEQAYLDNNVGGYNIGKKSSGGDNITAHPDRDLIVSKIKEASQQRLSNMTKEEKQKQFSRPMESNSNWKGGTTYSYCQCGIRKKPKAKTCSRCRDRFGINNPFHGKTHSEETKAKLRDIANARTTKPSNSKKVMADGILYQTGHEAAKAFGITRGLVNYRCKSDKYNWMFVD